MSDPVAEAAAQLAVGTQEGGAATAGEPASVAEQTAPPIVTEAVTAEVATTAAPVSEAATEELPNAAPAAVESTTEPDSAPSAVGADTTYTTAASSVEPLHVRVAAHLEAIFQMVKTDAEAAPSEAAAHAQTVKTHIGDVLRRISNGMAVAEGELVQKLEALYRAL